MKEHQASKQSCVSIAGSIQFGDFKIIPLNKVTTTSFEFDLELVLEDCH